MDRSMIIGLIISIALIAGTLAMCLYLYSLKTRDNGADEETEAPSDHAS